MPRRMSNSRSPPWNERTVEGKTMARVLLDPAERKRRADLSKRNWIAKNYDYNKIQKRALGARPAYLAIRRQRYQDRKPLPKPTQATSANVPIANSGPVRDPTPGH
jgi:hypothetical protein